MPAGQQNRIVVNNGETWGTEQALDKAGGGIYASLFTPDDSRDAQDIEALGTTVASEINDSNRNCTATLTGPFTYQYIGRVIQLFTGTDTATIVAAGPTYTHKMTSSLVTLNKFISVGEEIPQLGGSTVYRAIPSAAGTQLTLSADVNQTIQYSAELLCDTLDYAPTLAAFGTATWPSTLSYAKMAAGDTDFFALADYGSAVVNQSISGFTFTWNTPREGGDHDTGAATIGLPDESGGQSGTLEIRLSRWAATTFMTDWLAGTRKSALFTFPTVGIGATPDNHLATLKFPKLSYVNTSAPTSGPGKMTATLNFKVLADADQQADASAATTGGAAWEMVITDLTTTSYSTKL